MKRNYGIDFLRLLSMFLVAMIHVMGQGGVLTNTVELSAKYTAVWFLEVIGYCAVNCFALISGYVMYQSKFKPSRMLNLALQTVFYTLSAVAFFLLVMPQAVKKLMIVYAVIPITSNQYWYISAYFGVLVLMPLLNNILSFTEKKTLRNCLLLVLLLFCIFPILTGKDPYSLMGGYSAIWLCIMYLAGGYVHKYNIMEKIRGKWAWLAMAVSLISTCGVKFALIPIAKYIPFLAMYKNSLISYTSPTVIVMSLSLLILCGKMKFSGKGEKLVGFLTPAVLGVYLLHTNPLIWEHGIKGFATGFVKYSCLGMVGMVLLSALAIFAAGIAADWIRIGLFRLFRIDRLGDKLDSWLLKTKIGMS